jgi:hypothetical protein
MNLLKWSILKANDLELYVVGITEDDTPVISPRVDHFEQNIAFCGVDSYELVGTPGYDDRLESIVTAWRIDNKVTHYEYLNDIPG